MKKIVKLTESDITRMVMEVINEIGNTPKGQYMLGRLQGRQSNQGNYCAACDTRNYATQQTDKKFPDGRTTNNIGYGYDVMSTANDLGYADEKNPQLSQDMTNSGGNIGNYYRNVRNNHLNGVSKF